MTKIDIFSGFLGAGKTTLIKKLIKEAYKGEKLVLIENEFGEIGIDGGFLKDAGIEITEMSQGCICCSLVGDFSKALKQVLTQFNPDRILIEPSGVGKLSDVIAAVKGVDDNIELNSFTTIVDVKKCKIYMKNFGEFFNNQIEHANAIILSRTSDAKPEKIKEAVDLIKAHNPQAVIVTTDWDSLDGTIIKAAMERQNTLSFQLEKLQKEHEEEEICPCCGGHHHHHHDEECECGHEHHHHHDEECECGHEHHHHHHADEIFQSVGFETAKKFTKDGLEAILSQLDKDEYGSVLRAKGIIEGNDGWLHFDYVPGEWEVRNGGADITGRICVIGANIKEETIKELFGV